jgi:hypothetical protein
MVHETVQTYILKYMSDYYALHEYHVLSYIPKDKSTVIKKMHTKQVFLYMCYSCACLKENSIRIKHRNFTVIISVT